MYIQLQAHNLAQLGQRGIDWVGVGDIVCDLLLPVLGVMCLLCLFAPVLGNARILKTDAPASDRHSSCVQCSCVSRVACGLFSHPVKASHG